MKDSVTVEELKESLDEILSEVKRARAPVAVQRNGEIAAYLVAPGTVVIPPVTRPASKEEHEAWLDRILAHGEAQMRRLCAERGLDWDKLNENEREAFVDDLLHEGK